MTNPHGGGAPVGQGVRGPEEKRGDGRSSPPFRKVPLDNSVAARAGDIRRGSGPAPQEDPGHGDRSEEGRDSAGGDGGSVRPARGFRGNLARPREREGRGGGSS
ncbi:MAG: hypothetical protein HY520_05295, partial [Candidatus Aenigmarchaeota archaeon]|nr:hypothetical protein [Candidatus Aenigmarchaeota archaeon]